MQVKIIHRANTQDALPRERLTNTIHERPARGAKVVSHFLPRRDGF